MRTGRSCAGAAAVAFSSFSSFAGVDLLDFLGERLGVVAGDTALLVVVVVVGADGFVALRRLDLEMVGDDCAAVGVPFRRVLLGGAV